MKSFSMPGRLAGRLREAMSAAPGRSMIPTARSLWLGSQRRPLGFLLLLLSLLGITWTEAQPPQLPKQAPTLQGKGKLGKDRSRGAVVSLRKGGKGFLGVRYPGPTPVLCCCDMVGKPNRSVRRMKGYWEGRRGKQMGPGLKLRNDNS